MLGGHQDSLDLGMLGRFTGVRRLSLMECTISGGLGPLRDLPALRDLSLSRCTPRGPLDLGALADLTELTIRVSDDTRVVGSDPVPSSRILTTRSRV
ncbi:hypothetical protein [Streptomyces sp. A5-4]|uniref:hypothetical protein n=1 Tax=Streptomyces sp. A5-4 TaxID=3384771 RepID=UPI003DA91C72